MKWYNHKLTWLNLVLRLFQLIGALVCIGYYGHDISNAVKANKYLDAKWMYALVVSSLAAATALFYLLAGFWLEFRTYSVIALWDLILGVLWVVVTGIFATMYIGKEKVEMDPGIARMKVAAGFDIANMALWLISGGYYAWRFLMHGGPIMFKPRTTVVKGKGERV
jgi:hypothetical protein